MGASSRDESTDVVRVLHVDDDRLQLDLTVDVLEREGERFVVHTATTVEEGLNVVDSEPIDCVVSDYELPERDGLAFLELVRSERPDLPFILFTGKGSEEIASEAIRAGVTDYLQKQAGLGQYAVLVNRIENAVSQYRTEVEYRTTRLRFRKLVEHSAEVIVILDEDGVIEYVTTSVRRVLGYDPEALIGEIAFEYVHPDDRDHAVARFVESVEHPDRITDVEYRFEHEDGSWVPMFGRARNLLDDPHVRGIAVYNRDISGLVAPDP